MKLWSDQTQVLELVDNAFPSEAMEAAVSFHYWYVAVG